MQNLQAVMDSTIVTVQGSANFELDAVVPRPRQASEPSPSSLAHPPC